MTFGNTDWSIRKAVPEDLDNIKKIADAHKRELGFIVRQALERSIIGGEVLVVSAGLEDLSGFAQYHHRKDKRTTLYNIAVMPGFRGHGMGRGLMDVMVEESLILKQDYVQMLCPEDLESNTFYSAYGCELIEKRPGKHRALNLWRWYLRA